MDQENLIVQITTKLEQHSEVGAAFLGGSHGRGESDALSDVDVYVVAVQPDQVQKMVTKLADSVSDIAPILNSKVLPNVRTINCITDKWQRFDLTVVTGVELGFLASGQQVKPLFDNLGISGAVLSTPPALQKTSSGKFLEDVKEFIRILGLSVVVKKRDDLIVAQTGTNLMRDILIRTMLIENEPQPQRGVLSLSQSLRPAQQAELQQLPAAEADWPAIEERTRAIADAFFPRARLLSRRLNAKWPDEFERVTRTYLIEEIGFEF
ncbi:MAG: hypothetical protein OXG15_10105 [Gammaproteobacteria bacterium]|nr:hypothetical protein [Gammaproteobacteria bacterium]